MTTSATTGDNGARRTVDQRRREARVDRKVDEVLEGGGGLARVLLLVVGDRRANELGEWLIAEADLLLHVDTERLAGGRRSARHHTRRRRRRRARHLLSPWLSLLFSDHDSRKE